MLRRQNLGLYIFLNIITLGVYGLFFWYRWTENVNTTCNGDGKDSANYVLVYILDWFSLGLYSLIWNAKMGERMFQAGEEYGLDFKHGGMFFMIWRIFFPLVGSIMKIVYSNKLVDAYNAKLAAEYAEEADDMAEAE